MPSIAVRDTHLYYEEHGAGAPILGIHGTPSSAALWVDAARELASLGRCVIYDRRGFSRSGRPEPFDTSDLADHVQDAVALLEALSATPAVVIGRSTGGLIALAAAHVAPRAVRALVLLEPAMLTADDEAATWAHQLRRRVLQAAADDPSSVAEAVLREVLGVDAWDTLPPDVRDVFTAAAPAVLAEARGRGLDLSAEPFGLTGEELSSITVPTLLLAAQDSPSMLHRVNDRLAAGLPHAEAAVVPGGHLIHPAHPLVVRFVERALGLR